jgi:hypothetical protein
LQWYCPVISFWFLVKIQCNSCEGFLWKTCT